MNNDKIENGKETDINERNNGQMTDSLTFIYSLSHIHSLTRSLTHIHSLTRSLTFIHSLATRSLIFIHPLIFIHSFVRSFVHSLTHSLTVYVYDISGTTDKNRISVSVNMTMIIILVYIADYNDNSSMKSAIFTFLIFAQNMDCGPL